MKFLEIKGFFLLPDDFKIEGCTLEEAMQSFIDSRKTRKNLPKKINEECAESEQEVKSIHSEDMQIIFDSLIPNIGNGYSRAAAAQVFDTESKEMSQDL